MKTCGDCPWGKDPIKMTLVSGEEFWAWQNCPVSYGGGTIAHWQIECENRRAFRILRDEYRVLKDALWYMSEYAKSLEEVIQEKLGIKQTKDQ